MSGVVFRQADCVQITSILRLQSVLAGISGGLLRKRCAYIKKGTDKVV